MQHTSPRRQTLAAIAAALAGPAITLPAWSQGAPSGATGKAPGISSKPYDPIHPPVKGDENKIRFLFTYDCQYCRSYHNGLIQWGSTLPKTYAFSAIPLITDPTNDNLVLAVFGRLIAQGVAPAKIPLYDFAMYSLLQGEPETGKSARQTITTNDVIQTLVNIGVDIKVIQKFMTTRGDAVQKRIPEHAEMVGTYKLTATPSVALLGRYVVNPDHANSNPQQFLLLLNGMISRLMQGGPDAI